MFFNRNALGIEGSAIVPEPQPLNSTATENEGVDKEEETPSPSTTDVKILDHMHDLKIYGQKESPRCRYCDSST